VEKPAVDFLVRQETKNFLSLLNKCWVPKENFGTVLHQLVAQGDPNNGSFSEQKACISWDMTAAVLQHSIQEFEL
jgi:hypothetical protein